MKKNLVVLLTAMAVAASMFAGCGSSEAPAADVAEEAVETEEAETEEVETEEVEAEDTEAVEGEMISDEDFATLQENYSAMCDAYNAVSEYYMSDDVEADEDVEAVLNEAADIINEMGEISQEELTEEDGMALNDSMLDILDVLDTVVDAM